MKSKASWIGTSRSVGKRRQGQKLKECIAIGGGQTTQKEEMRCAVIQLGMKLMWKVQRDDGTVLVRHDSKPKAMAAALRFSADGCSYSVIEEPSAAANPLTDRGHLLSIKPR
jgi:hypothetical protein